jgi:hypothetical protein
MHHVDAVYMALLADLDSFAKDRPETSQVSVIGNVAPHRHDESARACSAFSWLDSSYSHIVQSILRASWTAVSLGLEYNERIPCSLCSFLHTM